MSDTLKGISNGIYGYLLKKPQLEEIKSDNLVYHFYIDEQIIFLNAIQTDHANYLVVVTRTACILYLIQKEQAKRVCSYLVNARKKP